MFYYTLEFVFLYFKSGFLFLVMVSEMAQKTVLGSPTSRTPVKIVKKRFVIFESANESETGTVKKAQRVTDDRPLPEILDQVAFRKRGMFNIQLKFPILFQFMNFQILLIFNNVLHVAFNIIHCRSS